MLEPNFEDNKSNRHIEPKVRVEYSAGFRKFDQAKKSESNMASISKNQ